MKLLNNGHSCNAIFIFVLEASNISFPPLIMRELII